MYNYISSTHIQNGTSCRGTCKAHSIHSVSPNPHSSRTLSIARNISIWIELLKIIHGPCIPHSWAKTFGRSTLRIPNATFFTCLMKFCHLITNFLPTYRNKHMHTHLANDGVVQNFDFALLFIYFFFRQFNSRSKRNCILYILSQVTDKLV